MLANDFIKTSYQGPPGVRYLAYPNSKAPRWLIPIDKTLRRKSLNLYLPQSYKAIILKQLMVLGYLPGEKVWLHRPVFESLLSLLSQVLGHSDLRLAFYLALPGIHQKTTVQAMDEQGRVIAFAKLARLASAKASLHAEKSTLDTLSSVSELEGHIPRMLDWRCWRDATVLITTPGPEARGHGTMKDSHHVFLNKLHRAFSRTSTFYNSTMWKQINALFEICKPNLTSRWLVRYGSALSLLKEQLGPQVVKLTLAHRDFAPWNTRRYPDGTLFVFDWEFAQEGYLQHYDYIHFNFMVKLLLKGHMSTRYIKKLAVTVDKDYGSLYILAYLLDIALFYHKMLFGRDAHEDDVVLQQVGQLLDTSKKWLV